MVPSVMRIDNAGNLLIKTGEIDLQGGNKTIKTSAGFLQVGTSGNLTTMQFIQLAEPSGCALIALGGSWLALRIHTQVMVK